MKQQVLQFWGCLGMLSDSLSGEPAGVRHRYAFLCLHPGLGGAEHPAPLCPGFGFPHLAGTVPVRLGHIRRLPMRSCFGELLGGFQSHLPPQYPHYGWIICIAVYGCSALAGAAVEKIGGKQVSR